MILDHIALIVSSEQCLRFYEKLGFKETNRSERSYETVVFMECEEIRTDWFGRKFTFTKDPDGQPIELKEKTVDNHSKQTGEFEYEQD